ncbi:MAG: TRAP transporter small permease [Desulfurococcaceae archaeon]
MTPALIKAINLVDKIINFIETPILITTGILLLSSLFYAGVVRYAHIGSFPEETELSWFLYTWMVFVGSSSVLRKGDHPHIRLMREKLGWKYEILLYIVSILYLSGIIYILISYRWLYAVQKTAVMRISLAYFYDAAIIGFSLMIIRYVIKILTTIHVKARGVAP